MAIRLRTVTGPDGCPIRVALCAFETDPEPGDVYLDDGDHYALAAKFRRDWQGQINDFPYPEEWAAMDTQKKRDAVADFPTRQELLAAALDRYRAGPTPEVIAELEAMSDLITPEIRRELTGGLIGD